jgi:hypothetical protein
MRAPKWLALAVLLLIAVGPWVLHAAYLDLFGVLTDGEITGKREAVVISGDHWRYDLVVSYRYRAADSPAPATAAQQVDAALYDRLAVGSRVKVRYSTWGFLRSLGSAGVSLADARWYSRLPHESNDQQWLLEIEMYAVVAVLGYLAYRRKSRPLVMIAVVAAAAVGAGVLLFGFLIFPLLLLHWWRRRGQGFGWVLLASMALSAVILATRIPWPARQPAGALVHTNAVVRQVHDVESVWGTQRFPGQQLRQPFQILDLEFTPPGSAEAVHAIDQVDRGSVPGFARGAAVAITYPASQPHAARVAAATRTYARNLFVYVLVLTYGTGALLLIVGWPIARMLGKVSATLSPNAEQLASRVASLPAEDPRRAALEKMLGARREAGQKKVPDPPH